MKFVEFYLSAADPIPTNFYMPKWALTKQKNIATTLGITDAQIYYASLNSKKDRDDLFKGVYGDMGSVFGGPVYMEVTSPMDYSLSPIRSRFEIFGEMIDVVHYIILGLGGFLLTISALFIFTTINKIAGDSKKEIAIFPSYGATKKDITAILNSYVLSMVTFGFIVGFVISIILTIIASIAWGETTFYFLVNSGNYFDIGKPLFMFLDFPWLYIIGFLGVLYLVGIVAAFIPVFKASRIQPILALRDE